MNLTRGTWPQPAGYSALRNLGGMLLGPDPISQLQPELLPPSLAPDWEWGAHLQFSAWVGDGTILSKVVPSHAP